MTINISKSSYIKGLQCHKALWLKFNKPELSEFSTETQKNFDTGHSVGDYAKDLFPNGTEIKFNPKNFTEMAETTENLIKTKKTIYEATFMKDNLFAMADILHKNKDGWNMYEVKASTSVKDYHIHDASFQKYLIEKSGLKLNRIYIIHINNQYERKGKINIKKLFTIKNITEKIKPVKEIEQNIKKMRNILKLKTEPKIDIGTYCNSPYECDFSSYCWKHIPEKSVFKIYKLKSKEKFKNYYNNIIKLTDINENIILNKHQQIQIESMISNKPYIDKKIIKESLLKKLKYPISYLDFETFMEAIPGFDNQRPYQQIPFQYSLHVEEKNGKIIHKEFLANEKTDPRLPFAEQIIKDLPGKGSIVTYNAGFEKGRINELANLFPNLQEELLEINSRIIDLLEPFKKFGYYHPGFNGSLSLKSVLPTLFPTNRELDYSAIAIHNGGEAMEIYPKLKFITDNNKIIKIRNDLLEYCKIDTLAMVKLVEFLKKL